MGWKTQLVNKTLPNIKVHLYITISHISTKRDREQTKNKQRTNKEQTENKTTTKQQQNNNKTTTKQQQNNNKTTTKQQHSQK